MQKTNVYDSVSPTSLLRGTQYQHIAFFVYPCRNINLFYLGVEVGMAPLLMRRPVAGVLVGLGAVAALVGSPTLMHVGVPCEQCCGSMKFLYGSGSVDLYL
jgi:hypothetical protein